jgi:hypothetical protein
VITIEAIRAYARFRGDQDGLLRGGTAAERATADRDTWWRLDRLLMEAGNLQAGHLAPAYAERVRASILAEMPDEQVRAEFFKLLDRQG